jgi:hypothetical protein
MTVFHLSRKDPVWTITGLCVRPDGMLVASGHFGPGMWPGDPCILTPDGDSQRITLNLKYSNSLCYDRANKRLLVAGNDGSDPRRSSDVPTGIFTMGPSAAPVTITTAGIAGHSLPIVADSRGTIFYPGYQEGARGQALLSLEPGGHPRKLADGFVQIIGLAVSDNGDVIVADAEYCKNQGAVLGVTRNGEVKVLVHERDVRPNSVAVAPDGSIFVASITGQNGDIGVVYKRDPSGVVSPYVTGLVQPRVAYDNLNQELVVANFLNFSTENSNIPAKFHNDFRILRLRKPHKEVAPFVQATATMPAQCSPASALCELQAKESVELIEGGPADLAERVNAQRKYLEPFLPPAFFSEEGIEQVIQLAFNASLEPEEGRYPKFRIIAGPNASTGSFVRFNSMTFPGGQQIPDVETLRRLAPTAASHSAALYFGEDLKGGKGTLLRCYGICDSERLLLIRNTSSANTAERETLQSPAFVLKVEGPGRIKAGILPGQLFLLKGGCLRAINSMESVNVVRDWFADIGRWQYERMKERNDVRIRELFDPARCSRIMANLWSQILWQVSDRRHGGAFVILPVNHGHWRHPHQYDIDCKFHGLIHCGEELLRFLSFCLDNTPAQGESHLYSFDLFWQRWKGDLANLVPLITDLANVDGCVVLDRRLQVLGFGGTITYRKEDGDSGGHRHLSAKSWCKKFRDGFAFVISQDGDVRVYHQSGEYGPLDPGPSIVHLT